MTRPSQLKKLLILRGVALLVVAVLVAIIVFLSNSIQGVRRDLTLMSFGLEQQLAGAVEQTALRSALDGRRHDIDRIQAMVPSRDDIGGLVSGVETEADRWDVTVRVPTVAELVRFTEEGLEIPASGPLEEIQLTINATGSPENLLRFLHAVEHLPYLASVATFHLNVAETIIPPGSSAVIPSGGPPGSGSAGESSTDKSELQVSMVLNAARAITE